MQNRKQVRVQICLADELKEKGRIRAIELGLSFSAYIRHLISLDVNEQIQRECTEGEVCDHEQGEVS